MKTTAVEVKLHMKDFTRYFEAVRLDKLRFPNGFNCYVELASLYKIVTGWRINHTLIPLDDIVAIIAFGSAVRYPGFRDVVEKRLFYGPAFVTHRVSIQPRDVDFFVLTGQNITREEVLEPLIGHDDYGGAYIARAGIQVVNRGIRQLLNGVKANDTVSISALREGVPIFLDQRFDAVVAEAGIVSSTPYKVFWDEDSEGLLFGRIQ